MDDSAPQETYVCEFHGAFSGNGGLLLCPHDVGTTEQRQRQYKIDSPGRCNAVLVRPGQLVEETTDVSN